VRAKNAELTQKYIADIKRHKQHYKPEFVLREMAEASARSVATVAHTVSSEVASLVGVSGSQLLHAELAAYTQPGLGRTTCSLCGTRDPAVRLIGEIAHA
jgi:hypothetical protein